MKLLIRVCFIIYLTVGASGHVCSQSLPITLDSLKKAEEYLKNFSDSLTLGTTDLARQAGNAGFSSFFFDLLANPETFQYPFDSLKAISKLKSPDKNIRIYTWMLHSRVAGTYQYFGLIQKMDPKTKKMKRIGMVEVKIETHDAENRELLSNEWYGALYYDIFERKIRKKTYYFLLGWHGNDVFTTRKVIDVLSFDQYDNVTFGAPVFVDNENQKRFRVIFEFTREAVMLLRYDKKKKMIVFDHLSPPSASAKGQYRYYGPDFTYDGYKFRKGVWNYKSHLDLRNPSEKK